MIWYIESDPAMLKRRERPLKRILRIHQHFTRGPISLLSNCKPHHKLNQHPLPPGKVDD
ncbi:hypothetical protein [Candidatus Villigracilis affinis]|uniref:hypothetical protein n=1 Tax=Candidatus Villigracilis affinis TaxID=3140682 RepID=UPI0031EB2C23